MTAILLAWALALWSGSPTYVTAVPDASVALARFDFGGRSVLLERWHQERHFGLHVRYFRAVSPGHVLSDLGNLLASQRCGEARSLINEILEFFSASELAALADELDLLEGLWYEAAQMCGLSDLLGNLHRAAAGSAQAVAASPDQNADVRPDETGPVDLRLIHVESGWPFVVFEGGEWMKIESDRAWQRAMRTFDGVVWVDSKGRYGRFVRESRLLPLRPAPIGFALSVLIWSFCWFGVIDGSRAVRRLIRQRRGQCPRCGYDLRGQFEHGCSECGWNR